MKKPEIKLILEMVRGNNTAQGNICMPWYNKAVFEGSADGNGKRRAIHNFPASSQHSVTSRA